MKSALKCHCGQRIFARDVMQQGYHVRHFGPSYVYLRFRCSRCKKLSEQFIRQDEWQEGMLRDDAPEASPAERRRFEQMGTISIDEMVAFHNELEQLDSVPDFREHDETTR
jgi:DNA-directed RNA polymerase subunit RPC12/RpoP